MPVLVTLEDDVFTVRIRDTVVAEVPSAFPGEVRASLSGGSGGTPIDYKCIRVVKSPALPMMSFGSQTGLAGWSMQTSGTGTFEALDEWCSGGCSTTFMFEANGVHEALVVPFDDGWLEAEAFVDAEAGTVTIEIDGVTFGPYVVDNLPDATFVGVGDLDSDGGGNIRIPNSNLEMSKPHILVDDLWLQAGHELLYELRD